MTNTKPTANGVTCKCGSTRFRVLRKTKSVGCNVRRLECSLCRERISTAERVIGTGNATGSVLAQISIGQIRESLDLLADLASGNSAEAQN